MSRNRDGGHISSIIVISSLQHSRRSSTPSDTTSRPKKMGSTRSVRTTVGVFRDEAIIWAMYRDLDDGWTRSRMDGDLFLLACST